MNNLNFVVGKQYKLVDASAGGGAYQAVLDMGIITLPKDNTFTCHALDGDGDCRSRTEGLLFLGHPNTADEGIMCADVNTLREGVFALVEDK